MDRSTSPGGEYQKEKHLGVSCDICKKKDFSGKRYKCLFCYDYDLCGECYDMRRSAGSHNPNHPVQCIITKSEYKLYYGGENIIPGTHALSYTCPLCNETGMSLNKFQEHAYAFHNNMKSDPVICPVCAAVPGGDPNIMTEDLADHLMWTHPRGPEDEDLYPQQLQDTDDENACGRSPSERLQVNKYFLPNPSLRSSSPAFTSLLPSTSRVLFSGRNYFTNSSFNSSMTDNSLRLSANTSTSSVQGRGNPECSSLSSNGSPTLPRRSPTTPRVPFTPRLGSPPPPLPGRVPVPASPSELYTPPHARLHAGHTPGAPVTKHLATSLHPWFPEHEMNSSSSSTPSSSSSSPNSSPQTSGSTTPALPKTPIGCYIASLNSRNSSPTAYRASQYATPVQTRRSVTTRIPTPYPHYFLDSPASSATTVRMWSSCEDLRSASETDTDTERTPQVKLLDQFHLSSASDTNLAINRRDLRMQLLDEANKARNEERKAERSLFVQDLVVSTMSETEQRRETLDRLFPAGEQLRKLTEPNSKTVPPK